MPAPNDNVGIRHDRVSGHEPSHVCRQGSGPCARGGAPVETEFCRMESVAGKMQALGELHRPSGFHPFDVVGSIARVNFVAHDGMAGVDKMDAELVHAAGFGEASDQCESPLPSLEAGFYAKTRQAWFALPVNDLADPDR